MSILDNIKKVFGSQKTDPVAEPTTASKELPASFYIDTIEADRVEKDRFFRTNPHSPIEDQINFGGLDYYEPDPDYRYTLTLQPAETQEELTFQTSTGDEQIYHRLGTIEFEVEGETGKLAIYQSPHHEGLFLPFRDATSGHETYGAGRYLEPQDLGGGKLLVDFNLCYNPFCAYTDAYSCPLPPFENHLKIAIHVGEKAFNK